ncbi:c-type cytochrome [Rhodopirellula sp. JC740]|uniref:C-type cytochrome n=2 Tax=Rhodopirellula halodulae TaxID=2894198 RepID=A0ABS8NB03_9BACT|nr:c-type cytochrome [Rhodopirellula sp. JC740]
MNSLTLSNLRSNSFCIRRKRLSLGLILAGMLSAGLAASSVSTSHADEPATPAASGKPDPLEPQIAEASDEGEQAMGGFKIPDGWEIRLFAAEPEVANIVAFDVDAKGRVFVAESYRQNRGVTDNRGHDDEWLLADLSAETVQDRIDYHKRLLGEAAITYSQHDDRIRRLVDTDGDGVADESVVLASGFNGLEEGTGAGVWVNGNDVYYTCIPKLWKLTDANDDGVAESKQVLSDGYGVRVAFRGHDMHGLIRGYDGRLYFSIGDRGYHVTTAEGKLLSNPAVGAVFRCELDGSNLEIYCDGLRNPQELAFNDVGDWFSVDNNSDSGDKARLVHLLEKGDSGWRMHYQYLPDRGPFNRLKIWEPHHNEQPAHIVPPIVNFTDGPSGLAYYPGTGFGDELNDQFLICDFRGGPSNSGIRSFQVAADGAFYKMVANDQPIWNLLATDVAFTPGGELLVSDWVDGWDGLGKGRLYRLFNPEHHDSDLVTEVRELLSGDLGSVSADDLAKQLTHADRRVRLNAQWELATRGELQPLIDLASSSDADVRHRLHGVWGSEHAVRVDGEKRPAVLAANRKWLSDSDPFIRAAACALAGDQNDFEAVSTMVGLLSDDSDRVQYFATIALSELLMQKEATAELKEQAIFATLLNLAKNKNEDPALRHACTLFLRRVGAESMLAGLATHDDLSVRRAAVAALRGQGSEKITAFLSDANSLVLAEAALAIHDRSIPAATDELAALISVADLPLNSDALLRRVLTANYRIGTPESAAALASFAASGEKPTWARVEAIDMLANWTSPDSRDRVTNQYRPLAKRPEVVAREALAKHIEVLMLTDQTVREKAIDVGSKLGIKKIAPELVTRLQDSQSRPASRASALTALARLNSGEAVKIARSIDLDQPTQLVTAALSVLGEHDGAASVDRFIAATATESQLVRGLAWDLLAEIESPQAVAHINKGVNAYLENDLPADVKLNVVEAAAKRLPNERNDKIANYRESLASTEPLAKWMDSLHGGDPDKGAKLFFGKTELSCVRCHQVDRTGGEVGPVLTTIGKTRDRRTLLEAIALPDAKIAEGFETAVIADEDGQVFTGIVATETDDVIELIAADGSRARIEKDYIIARKKGKSSMPAGLTEQMTARELRDLVAYLASLQVDPRAGEEGGHE